MEFKEVVSSRRSVHEFADREVSRDTIRSAVETARNAPSAWNLQPWKLVVLNSDQDRKRAVETSYSQEWMLEADKILVLLGDTEFKGAEDRMEDFVEKGYKTREEAEDSLRHVDNYREKPWEWRELEVTTNCMFFASDLLEALWEEGVGSCPVKGFDQEELGKVLEVDRWYPVLMIPVGYPGRQMEKKSRKTVDNIIEFV